MIGDVTDLDIPADLIDLKRRFIALTQQQESLAKELPSSTAIAGGKAAFTDEQRAGWDRLRAELGDLAVQIHAHPFLASLPMAERYKADEAASKVARAGG